MRCVSSWRNSRPVSGPRSSTRFGSSSARSANARFVIGAWSRTPPTAGEVCTVEPVDGTQTDFEGAAGMSASAAWARAQKWVPAHQKNKKSAANSALLSSCEYARINSRCGGGYADHPLFHGCDQVIVCTTLVTHQLVLQLTRAVISTMPAVGWLLLRLKCNQVEFFRIDY